MEDVYVNKDDFDTTIATTQNECEALLIIVIPLFIRSGD